MTQKKQEIVSHEWSFKIKGSKITKVFEFDEEVNRRDAADELYNHQDIDVDIRTGKPVFDVTGLPNLTKNRKMLAKHPDLESELDELREITSEVKYQIGKAKNVLDQEFVGIILELCNSIKKLTKLVG